MKEYNIIIKVEDAGGTYSACDIDEAKDIAQREADDIYERLGGRCSVMVEDVEEIK